MEHAVSDDGDDRRSDGGYSDGDGGGGDDTEMMSNSPYDLTNGGFDLARLRLSSLASAMEMDEEDDGEQRGHLDLPTDDEYEGDGKSGGENEDEGENEKSQGSSSSDLSEGRHEARSVLDDIVKSLEGGEREKSTVHTIRDARKQWAFSDHEENCERETVHEPQNGDHDNKSDAHAVKRLEEVVVSEEALAMVVPARPPVLVAEDKAKEEGEPRVVQARLEECAFVQKATRVQDNTKSVAGAAVHPLPQLIPLATSPTTLYSLKTLFPVVYEKEIVPTGVHTIATATATNARTMNEVKDSASGKAARQTKASRLVHKSPCDTRHKNDTTPKAPVCDPVEDSASRHAGVLRKQLSALEEEHERTTKSLTRQLQVAESDHKQLAQRNTRLKSQLATLTADLTRSKADAAKWKTENELYACKIPKLQADLCHETTQVDETHAQTIQFQLEVAQLRAKCQVLQTKCGSADAQVDQLQQELRNTKKELRRRTLLQQQCEEKIKKLETETYEMKTVHAQELLLSKNKLSATVQRMTNEFAKKENEMKKIHHQQFEECKINMENAVKKRKQLDHSHSHLAQQLQAMKKRLEDQEAEAQTKVASVRNLEMLLVRAERTESSLRNQVTALKVQVQSVELEKKKVMRSASGNGNGNGQAVRQLRRPILSSHSRNKQPTPERADLGGDEVDQCAAQQPTVCSCCLAIMDSDDKLSRIDLDGAVDDQPNNDPVPPAAFECPRCPSLEEEAAAAQKELARVCLLHAAELKVQCSAYERALAACRYPSRTSNCA